MSWYYLQKAEATSTRMLFTVLYTDIFMPTPDAEREEKIDYKWITMIQKCITRGRRVLPIRHSTECSECPHKLGYRSPLSISSHPDILHTEIENEHSKLVLSRIDWNLFPKPSYGYPSGFPSSLFCISSTWAKRAHRTDRVGQERCKFLYCNETSF